MPSTLFNQCVPLAGDGKYHTPPPHTLLVMRKLEGGEMKLGSKSHECLLKECAKNNQHFLSLVTLNLKNIIS